MQPQRIHAAQLAARGIHFPKEARFYLPKGIAMDAATQSALITQSNAGVPAALTTYVDPDVIRVLYAPMKAPKIFGEVKKGDFVTPVAMFPIAEATGEVSSYGDFNNGGSVNYNVNWPQRQSYHFQTISQWGERELEMMARGQIDAASQINISSALALAKAQNRAYFFGVQGLQNYGLLNDPNLLPPIAPGPKAYNSNLVGPWFTNGVMTATPAEVYTDVQSLFGQLVNQTLGLVDTETEMVLALSPASSVALTGTNQYNVNVEDQLKKNFPNLRVETAAEYQNSTTGNIVQLIAKSIDGQDVGYCAYTEKLRAHPVVTDLSGFRQKKSMGTWGAIVRVPMGIATMIGV